MPDLAENISEWLPSSLSAVGHHTSLGFDALATELAESAFVLAAFDSEIDVREHLHRLTGNGLNLLTTFLRERNRLAERVKSLHPPLIVIPDSLHPADQAA